MGHSLVSLALFVHLTYSSVGHSIVSVPHSCVSHTHSYITVWLQRPSLRVSRALLYIKALPLVVPMDVPIPISHFCFIDLCHPFLFRILYHRYCFIGCRHVSDTHGCFFASSTLCVSLSYISITMRIVSWSRHIWISVVHIDISRYCFHPRLLHASRTYLSNMHVFLVIILQSSYL